MDKSSEAFRTISEVADDLDLPQHVLRFWETRFTQIRPLKRGGGRRYYRPDDVELLRAIRHLLYGEGYTIKGVQKILKEQGARAVIALRGDAASANASGPSPFDDVPSAQDNGTSSNPEEGNVAVREILLDDARIGAAESIRLAPSDLDRLRAALAELVECERLLVRALDQTVR
jgi:DNA-binding transcriptional MerR regulator